MGPGDLPGAAGVARKQLIRKGPNRHKHTGQLVINCSEIVGVYPVPGTVLCAPGWEELPSSVLDSIRMQAETVQLCKLML